MDQVATKKTRKKAHEYFSLRGFWIVVRMLLSDKSKISFRSNLKGSIVRIVSSIVLFAVLIAISYMFYYVAVLMNIFSVIAYVPISVPSIIMGFLLAFGFLSLLSGLTKSLYRSPDNRILLTYPCSGSTIFLARVTVYLLHEFMRNVVVQIPLLMGYMILMKAPMTLYFWVFVAFFVISLFETLLASLLSVPYHLFTSFLDRHPFLKMPLLVAFFVFIAAFSVWGVLAVPDTVDVFSDWSHYFRIIQSAMNAYAVDDNPMYLLSVFSIGKLNGFSYRAFDTETWTVLLVLLGGIVVMFLGALFLINPFYLRLNSSDGPRKVEKEQKPRKSRLSSPILSEIRKEALLIAGGKGGRGLPSFALAFVILPFLAMALGKFFAGMALSRVGMIYVETIMLLIFLLIALCSTNMFARSYSEDGMAFRLTRTYPRSNFLFILSKWVFPGTLGTVSLGVSTYLYAYFYHMDGAKAALFFFSTFFLFVSASLFSLISDFLHPSNLFAIDGSVAKAETSSTIFAFVVSLVVTVLFYLYRCDAQLESYVKLFIVSSILLVVTVLLFYMNARYRGKEDRR